MYLLHLPTWHQRARFIQPVTRAQQGNGRIEISQPVPARHLFGAEFTTLLRVQKHISVSTAQSCSCQAPADMKGLAQAAQWCD